MDEIKKFELSDRLFIVATILVVAITFSIVVGIYAALKNLPGLQPREITVIGEGKVYIAPDIATVQLGVTNEGNEEADIPLIVKKNIEKINVLIETVKNIGIDEKDIKTTQYSLTPRYDWVEGERVFKGYTMTQEILVKIRDFTKIGNVLSKATELGANLVGSLSFSIDNPEQAKQEARTKAIAEAKSKAESMAKAAGLKLVKVLNVYDNYYPYYGYGGDAMYAKVEGVKVPEPQIQPGQTEITANVTVVYRVR